MIYDLEALSDIPVSVEVRLNSSDATLEKIARLEAGAELVLDRVAGEAVDLYVGNVPVASAEIIVIEDRLSVRIREIFATASA